MTNLQSNTSGISGTSGTISLGGSWQNPGTITETNSTVYLGGISQPPTSAR